MPVLYQLDEKRSLIRTRCVGDTTLQEVLDHFRELESDASMPEGLDVLLDLSETESIPESDQLRSVVGKIEALRGKLRWGSCAIVASRDVLYGMSRVFQAYAEAHFANSIVLRDLEAAEAWLASLRPPEGR